MLLLKLLFLFRLTIADTKKVGEKTLFVELIVKMKTNKSYAICPLRKQIQSGKLGKYTVEKFLDICEGGNMFFL